MRKHTFWTPTYRAIGAREARALCRAAGTTLRAVKTRAHQRGSCNFPAHGADRYRVWGMRDILFAIALGVAGAVFLFYSI